MAKRTILWFRNDLRIHDNQLLNAAAATAKFAGSDMICVYCFDPRHYQPTAYSTHKTGIFRSKFLIESVANLRFNLRRLGCDLLVALEKPELFIPKLVHSSLPTDVLVQSEVTSEETKVEKKVEKGLSLNGAILHRMKGGFTLFHPEDIPYEDSCSNLPNLFTTFRNKVESTSKVRNLLPLVKKGRLPPSFIPAPGAASDSSTSGADYLPDLLALGFSDEEIRRLNESIAVSEGASDAHPKGVMPFTGGEDAALARLQQWMFADDRLQHYFNIRNGMLGEGYSTKLSPWLSAGCISPRLIYHESKRYELERGISNKSTYWIVFELLCRDFFRFLCTKHGDRIFHLEGAEGNKGSTPRKWSTDADKIARWKTGTTGQPLVDANMRELMVTGWMSNRGRQNVASYLVLEMGVDWRVGADHFESYLLDHDVCSNYGNWNAAAGLTGGRVNKFNCVKQSGDYDPEGLYIRHWLPELARVPVPLLYQPSKLAPDEQRLYGVKIGVDYPREMYRVSSTKAVGDTASESGDGMYSAVAPALAPTAKGYKTKRPISKQGGRVQHHES